MSRSGTLNIVARSEDRRGRYPLVQLQKRWGRPWTIWQGGSARCVIAYPARAHNAAWRQRVTMEPKGRLYLNFRYYPNVLLDPEARS